MWTIPILKVIHIAAGSVALLAGAGAMTFYKGSRAHRRSGNLFFLSMLVMSALGAGMAAAKPDYGTALMGALTFYLVSTAWLTVIRREGETGRFERLAMAAASVLAILALSRGFVTAGQPNDYPAFFYFAVGSILAALALLDWRVVRNGIAGAQRLIRHLWRMGFAFFIAAGSLFLGQPDVFPGPLKPVAIRAVPVLLVVGLTFFWLIRVSFMGWHGRRANQGEPGIRQGIGWRGRAGAAGTPGQPAP